MLPSTQPPHVFANQRWSDYELVDDYWIYPSRDRIDAYEATGDEDLPSLLARVSVPTESQQDQLKNLLEFERHFGLLGFTSLSGQPRRRKIEGRLLLTEADDWNWAISHAENVRQLLLLHRARRATLDKLLDQFVERQRHAAIQVPVLREPWFATLDVDVRQELKRRPNPLEAARLIVATSLNPNLEGVYRCVDSTTGQTAFRFQALVQVIYWQLADQLGTERIRICRCGSPFFATDARQRFCPPFPGKTESRCGKRFRMRRLRNEKRRTT